MPCHMPCRCRLPTHALTTCLCRCLATCLADSDMPLPSDSEAMRAMHKALEGASRRSSGSGGRRESGLCKQGGRSMALGRHGNNSTTSDCRQQATPSDCNCCKQLRLTLSTTTGMQPRYDVSCCVYHAAIGIRGCLSPSHIWRHTRAKPLKRSASHCTSIKLKHERPGDGRQHSSSTVT